MFVMINITTLSWQKLYNIFYLLFFTLVCYSTLWLRHVIKKKLFHLVIMCHAHFHLKRRWHSLQTVLYVLFSNSSRVKITHIAFKHLIGAKHVSVTTKYLVGKQSNLVLVCMFQFTNYQLYFARIVGFTCSLQI